MHSNPMPRIDERGLHAHFSRQYTAHYDFVRIVVRRAGIPDADADDVVQDVFLLLLQRLAQLHTAGSLRAWLATVARLMCRNRRRGYARRAKCFDAGASLENACESPSRAIAVRDFDDWRTCNIALDKLSDCQRRVLLLCAVEDHTAGEIGALLGVSPNTVASQLRAARARVRSFLDRKLCVARHHALSK